MCYSLIGVNGNALSVIAYVKNAMQKEGFTKKDIAKYQKLALSRGYTDLLQVSLDMLDMCNNVAFKHSL